MTLKDLIQPIHKGLKFGDENNLIIEVFREDLEDLQEKYYDLLQFLMGMSEEGTYTIDDILTDHLGLDWVNIGEDE